MRVVIQNCFTEEFLSPDRTWISDVEKAENFEKTLRAWAEIDERQLSGVRIVLHIGDGVPDVPLATVGGDKACSPRRDLV
jgi:hypothetical protein